MTKAEMSDIETKVNNAKAKIDEIKRLRTEYQTQLKQLELNEAGWLGYIEALSPYLTQDSSTTED